MGNQGQLYFGLFLTSNTLLMAIFLLSGFLLLAIIISMMRIYKKAGKPAISVIVPFWGQIVLFQIAELPWWYIFIPIFNIIMMIKAYVLLAKKFGKGTGFAIGIIFLPMIFIPLLSFYDYIGNKPEKTIDTPIYNPFNQTNMEAVMPETPIVPNEVFVPNVIETQVTVPVDPTVTADLVNSVETVIPNENINVVAEPIDNIPVIEENNVVETSVISEVPEIPAVEEIVANIAEVQSVENNILNKNIETIENVVPEAQSEIIDNLEIEQNLVEPMNQNIGGEVIASETEVQNPTVQDIRNALNINENSVVNETINIQAETVENLENLESLNNIEVNQENVIEMPEMAAKVCPACGVSLSGDNNFCTSCGTKI